MLNKIRKIDSSATPAQARAYHGPATAGIEYDIASGGGLVLNHDGTRSWRAAGLLGVTALAAQHLDLNTVTDSKTVRVNSRNFTQTSGSSIGMQSKPSQTVNTSGDVIGAEFSPRLQSGVTAGSLIGVRSDPILKGTSGNLSGNVVSFESNIDLTDPTSTRTITGKVAGWRVFPDFGSATVTGKKSVVVLATPNSGAWDYFLDVETSGIAVGSAGTYSTADGYLLIRVPAGDMRIPFFAAVD